MDKIKTIMMKEWAEVFKNKIVLFTVAFLPVVFLFLPLGTLVTMDKLAASTEAQAMSDSVPPEAEAFFGDLCKDLGSTECTEVYLLNVYTLLFMMLPLIVPTTIASYSVVGEKTNRSLEPLLATPITTTELVAGKAIAAVVPAVVSTWGAFILYVIGAWFLTTPVVFGYLIAPVWLTAVFLVSPLLGLLSVSFGLMISSRVTDPRSAEQLSGLVVMPVILLVVGQSLGLILINQQLIIIVGVVVGLLDILLLYLSVQLFERENILTRWK